MRVIDADVLQNLMYHEAFEVDSDMQKWDSGCWIRYKVFENCLAKTPTLDDYNLDQWCVDCKEYDQKRHYCPRFNRVIRETVSDFKKEHNKTGKWIEYDSHCECSFCHSVWWYVENKVEFFNYCPNCGAKMMATKGGSDYETN